MLFFQISCEAQVEGSWRSSYPPVSVLHPILGQGELPLHAFGLASWLDAKWQVPNFFDYAVHTLLGFAFFLAAHEYWMQRNCFLRNKSEDRCEQVQFKQAPVAAVIVL